MKGSRREYPTQEELREIFSYSPAGFLVRRSTGRRAGHWGTPIRRMVKIGYVKFYEHVLIFIYHHGYRPLITDHINRNTLDNRISNLRAADRSMNSWNQKLAKSKLGIRGVYAKNQKTCTTYRVFIGHKGKPKYVGSAKTVEDAVHMRKAAELTYFGQELS